MTFQRYKSFYFQNIIKIKALKKTKLPLPALHQSKMEGAENMKCVFDRTLSDCDLNRTLNYE